MAAVIVAVLAAISVLTTGAASASGPPEATLFDNKDFNNDGKNPGGDSLVVTGDISCLSDSPHNFDNRAQSIMVNPGTVVTVYELCGFQGESDTFFEHDSDLQDNHIGKDTISSIKISSNDQSLGNDHKELQAQIAQLELDLNAAITASQTAIFARLDELADEIVGTVTPETPSLGTQIAEIGNLLGTATPETPSLGTQIAQIGSSNTAQNAQLTAILDLVTGTHLIDPYDMAVTVCATYGPDAEVSEHSGLDMDFILNGGVGVDYFGNGVSIDYEADFGHGIYTDIGAGVTLELEACLNGIFYRQDGSADSFSTADLLQSEIDLINKSFAAGGPGSAGDRERLRTSMTSAAFRFAEDISVDNLEKAIEVLQKSSFKGNGPFLDNSIANPFAFAHDGPSDYKNILPVPTDVRGNLGGSFPTETFSNFNFSDITAICGLFTSNPNISSSASSDVQGLCDLDKISAEAIEDAFEIIADLPNQITTLFSGATTFATNAANDAKTFATNAANDAQTAATSFATTAADDAKTFATNAANDAQTAATSFATTAADDAETAANTFATTAANSAQAAAQFFATDAANGAETAANTFATNAANGAETAANTFATNAANGAETAANTFATNAANGAETAANTFATNAANGAQAAAQFFATTAANDAGVAARSFATDIVNDAQAFAVILANDAQAAAESFATTAADDAFAASRLFATGAVNDAQAFAVILANDAQTAAQSFATGAANDAQTAAESFATDIVNDAQAFAVILANDAQMAAESFATTAANGAANVALAPVISWCNGIGSAITTAITNEVTPEFSVPQIVLFGGLSLPSSPSEKHGLASVWGYDGPSPVAGSR